LRAQDLLEVAKAALIHGSGLEITNRANLQIRGVRPEAHRFLVRDLVGAGLVLTDAAADARRNVLASPTAGCDPCEVTDTRVLVAETAGALAKGVGLSPKFGVLVDSGGLTHVRGRRYDMCLGAVKLRDGRIGYEVRLAEALPEGFAMPPRYVVAAHDAYNLIASALELMAKHVDANGRMSGLIELLGEEEVLHQAAARSGARLLTVAPGDICAKVESAVRPIGVLPQRQAGRSMVGAMPILGRLSAEAFGAIARVAGEVSARFEDAEVRLTPWRSILIPNVPTERADAALAALEGLGLAVVASDPALSVVACAGSTGCPASFTDTQQDGRVVVAALRSASPNRLSVHLSGCTKRCADSTTEFDVTLVGGPGAGSYEVVVGPNATHSLTIGAFEVEAAAVAERVVSIARSGKQ
jgi:precorrin-3B synthase